MWEISSGRAGSGKISPAAAGDEITEWVLRGMRARSKPAESGAEPRGRHAPATGFHLEPCGDPGMFYSCTANRANRGSGTHSAARRYVTDAATTKSAETVLTHS